MVTMVDRLHWHAEGLLPGANWKWFVLRGALALILGIDPFLDMGRSATSVMGNAVATSVVAKWEGELDLDHVPVLETE